MQPYRPTPRTTPAQVLASPRSSPDKNATPATTSKSPHTNLHHQRPAVRTPDQKEHQHSSSLGESLRAGPLQRRGAGLVSRVQARGIAPAGQPVIQTTKLTSSTVLAQARRPTFLC